MAYITVPSSYVIYEVPEETFELLPIGMKTLPPQIVLEVMVMEGKAKRIGTVGSFTMPMEGETEDDEDEDPPEGEGPWVG